MCLSLTESGKIRNGWCAEHAGSDDDLPHLAAESAHARADLSATVGQSRPSGRSIWLISRLRLAISSRNAVCPALVRLTQVRGRFPS
jgi:hypothetical protein